MRKLIFITLACFGFLIYSVTIVHSQDMDDIDRSFKDFEREMRLKTQQQSLEQNLGSNIKRFKVEKETTKDRAAIKNEERFKKFMESQNKNLAKDLGGWGIRIPKEQRIVIELFAIAIFISFFSFLFYKQRHKRLEEEKESDKRKF